jgi:sec-independent protein translocase protein TatA
MRHYGEFSGHFSRWQARFSAKIGLGETFAPIYLQSKRRGLNARYTLGQRGAKANLGANKEVFMFGLGGNELMIVLVLVLVLFGGSKVPQLMKGMGEGMKEFKKATKDEDEVRPISTTTVTNPVVSERIAEKPIETHSEPRV